MRKYTRKAASRRRLLQRAGLATKAFDALPAHIAVVDERGFIIAANAPWVRFAQDSGIDSNLERSATGVGANYFEVCRRAEQAGDADAGLALAGMLDVLEGRRPAFEHEYPYHTPDEERWLTMRVALLEAGPQRALVIAHWPTTRLREQQQSQALAAARVEARVEADAASERERERELASLTRLSGAPRLSVTGRAFALLPLYETSPAIFQHLLSEYESILKQALDERAYKVETQSSDRLRRMAEQLGFMRAGPRDLMKIHTASLRELLADWPAGKAQALTEEARLAVLELMGHLLNYYRRRAVMSGTGQDTSGQAGPGSPDVASEAGSGEGR